MLKKFNLASYLTNCSNVTMSLIFFGLSFYYTDNFKKLIIFLVASFITSNIISLFIIKPILSKLLNKPK